MQVKHLIYFIFNFEQASYETCLCYKIFILLVLALIYYYYKR